MSLQGVRSLTPACPPSWTLAQDITFTRQLRSMLHGWVEQSGAAGTSTGYGQTAVTDASVRAVAQAVQAGWEPQVEGFLQQAASQAQELLTSVRVGFFAARALPDTVGLQSVRFSQSTRSDRSCVPGPPHTPLTCSCPVPRTPGQTGRRASTLRTFNGFHPDMEQLGMLVTDLVSAPSCWHGWRGRERGTQGDPLTRGTRLTPTASHAHLLAGL